MRAGSRRILQKKSQGCFGTLRIGAVRRGLGAHPAGAPTKVAATAVMWLRPGALLGPLAGVTLGDFQAGPEDALVRLGFLSGAGFLVA